MLSFHNTHYAWKDCEASFKEAGFDYIVTEKMVCAGGEKGEEIKYAYYVT